MNTHALAAEIVTKVRNSMQDSTLNQSAVVERMIREALDGDTMTGYGLSGREPHPMQQPTALPQPEWPPKVTPYA